MSYVRHGSSADDETSFGTMRNVFLRWERWRIAYNLALVGLVISLAVTFGGSDSNWSQFVVQCVFGAILANICYFAGPITDAYLRWLGIHYRVIAPLLFACGLVFAIGLAAVTVGSSLMPF
jgi:hypothetical protein